MKTTYKLHITTAQSLQQVTVPNNHYSNEAHAAQNNYNSFFFHQRKNTLNVPK